MIDYLLPKMNAKIKGLSSQKIETQRKKYGWNEIKEKTETPLQRFFKKIFSPIPIMIEGAFLLSVLSGRLEDSIIILVLLCVNVGVDFMQEQKAQKALESLKETLAPTALVLRNEKFEVRPSRELVPGDIVKLVLGDVVPADIEFISGDGVEVDQATITGESLPVEKKQGDILYASSIVQTGNLIAKVQETGINTFIGKSAHLVAKAENENQSNFQKTVFMIGKFLIAIATFLIFITFLALIARGEAWLDTLRFALVLAVASIPVALPAVLSITMAIGAQTLAKGKAIVSNFVAIEELASINLLCVDKTGTLTKNEIAIETPKAYSKYTEEDLFTYALLSTDLDGQTPIEKAIIRYAESHKFNSRKEAYNTLEFRPFNPVVKKTHTIVEHGKKKIEIILGAPQVIIESLESEKEQKSTQKDVENLAKKGLRTLLVAKKEDKGFEIVGVLPLVDPPREDSAEVIVKIKKLGVDIKMITGDHKLIAQYIANKLSLGKNIVEAKELHKIDNTSSLDIRQSLIENGNVFTEVTPEDKYNIVSRLQSTGQIVAMTGDGVNDSPALKKADVGVAVSGASPAARSASDLILLSNGLSIIANAIVSARATFSRMQSYATFRIAETIRIVFFISFAVIFFNDSPLTAAMIILLALLNDIPVISIAYDNAQPSKVPVRWELKKTLFISTILGLTGLVSSFLLLWYLHSSLAFSLALIQTIIFLKLDVSGHSTLYVTRTGKNHFWEKPYPSLKFFLPAFSSRIIGTIIAYYGILMEPIGFQIIGYIWIYSTIWFVVNDFVKVWSYKFYDRFLAYKSVKKIVELPA